MREMELFFNMRQSDLRQAVLCVGSGFTSEQLRHFVDRLRLDSLTLTGTLPEEDGRKLLESLNGAAVLPKNLTWCPLEWLTRPDGVFALVAAGLEDNGTILNLRPLEPDYLVGEVRCQKITSFDLWEAFRHCCRHIQLVTLREGLDRQVLDWEKNPDNNVELSVVFPMYNVAKYLDQCIGSVTAWKADYIEFLFVNDGSPDNSREIVLEYAKKDPRIKLLDKENGGCASARQHGLDHARGSYVGFIDPDDFIDETMFRKLLCAAMTGGYEISYCGYKEYYDNNGQTMEVLDALGAPYREGCTDPTAIQELITGARVAIWRGIYKMRMLQKNNIRFYTELRRFDDLPFKVETFAVARSVIAVEEHLYYYRLARPGQDVAADDERLYVHFPIFRHLNESIASRKDSWLTDRLQLCKLHTHRYALKKLRPEFIKAYARQAKQDFNTTGRFLRTYLMFREFAGREGAAVYLAIMQGNTRRLEKLCKK